MKYGEPEEYEAAKASISQVPKPERDPVLGVAGGIMEEWTISPRHHARSGIPLRDVMAEVMKELRQLLSHCVPDHQVINVEIRVDKEVAHVIRLHEIEKAFSQLRVSIHGSTSSLAH